MKLSPSLSPDLASWAERQPVFFTGSAGTHARHINVSPKGMTDTHFAILSPTQAAYVDRTGSGCETIAHAYDNARLCLMFMSFGEAPRIMRLFCTASVVEYDNVRFPVLLRRIVEHRVANANGLDATTSITASTTTSSTTTSSTSTSTSTSPPTTTTTSSTSTSTTTPPFDGARAIILANIWQVQTSCGFGVPRVKSSLYKPSLVDETSVFETRPTLDAWAAKQAHANKIRPYQSANNVDSIDGLPGLRAARRDVGQTLWLVDLLAWWARIRAEKDAVAVGFVAAILLLLLLRVVDIL